VVGVLLLVLAASACGRAEARSEQQKALQVGARQFRFHGMPGTVDPGMITIAFANRESFPFRHEMVLVSLQAGQSAGDIVAAAKKQGPDSEDLYLNFGEIGEVNTGATKVGLFQLPPGTYALACWETDKPGGGDGPVHAARGMVFQFTVR
jgi:hypothetical protein